MLASRGRLLLLLGLASRRPPPLATLSTPPPRAFPSRTLTSSSGTPNDKPSSFPPIVISPAELETRRELLHSWEGKEDATGQSYKMKYCPFCSKPHKHDPTNLFTLWIDVASGGYHCHRCLSSGRSWLTLKSMFETRLEGLRNQPYPSGVVPSPRPRKTNPRRKNATTGESSSSSSSSKTAKPGVVVAAERPKKIPLPSHAKCIEYHIELMKAMFHARRTQRQLDEELEPDTVAKDKRKKQPTWLTAGRRLKEPNLVSDYFIKKRGLRVDTLQRFLIGVSNTAFRDPETGRNLVSIVFPILARPGEFDPANPLAGPVPGSKPRFIRLKIRALEKKELQRTSPAGGLRGLFGWHLIHPKEKDLLIVTEGEFDAMVVAQETGLPAVSVPNGASSFPKECIPALARFKRIILWYDFDEAGRAGAAKAAAKLGRERCIVVPELPYEELRRCHPAWLASELVVTPGSSTGETRPSPSQLTYGWRAYPPLQHDSHSPSKDKTIPPGDGLDASHETQNAEASVESLDEEEERHEEDDREEEANDEWDEEAENAAHLEEEVLRDILSYHMSRPDSPVDRLPPLPEEKQKDANDLHRVGYDLTLVLARSLAPEVAREIYARRARVPFVRWSSAMPDELQPHLLDPEKKTPPLLGLDWRTDGVEAWHRKQRRLEWMKAAREDTVSDESRRRSSPLNGN